MEDDMSVSGGRTGDKGIEDKIYKKTKGRKKLTRYVTMRRSK